MSQQTIFWQLPEKTDQLTDIQIEKQNGIFKAFSKNSERGQIWQLSGMLLLMVNQELGTKTT